MLNYRIMRKQSIDERRFCPHCRKVENQISKGKNPSGTHRCYCKDCKKTYTLNPKRREIPEEIREQTIKTFYSRQNGAVDKVWILEK